MAAKKPAYRQPGRPSQFDRLLELSKIAWAPVLEMLGKEVSFKDLDAKKYEFKAPFPFWKTVLQMERNGRINHTDFIWLTADDIVRIHDEMIRSFGGELGVIEKSKLETTIERARSSVFSGQDFYPTILHKAAAMLHQILLYHPFVDGQKRTGISSAFIFLGLNGYLMWSRDIWDEVHFAISVAKGDFEVERITEWLAARVAPKEMLETAHLPKDWFKYGIRKKRQCSVCGRRAVPMDQFLVRCGHCGTRYKVVINAALARPRTHSVFVDFGIRMISS